MQKYLIERRKKLGERMEDNSVLLCFAGIPIHTSEDEYYPFLANRQYVYLTGLSRENQVLMMTKSGGKVSEYLFIDEPDPFTERWNGKMPTKEEVSEISGIREVMYTDVLEARISRVFGRGHVDTMYFDTYRLTPGDLPDYNLVQAKKYADLFPAVRLCDLHALIAEQREVKDAYEIEMTRKAIDITDKALQEVLKRLRPGMTEYQVQAVFEGTCMYEGADCQAFPTIAAAGINACSMHYGTNRDTIRDGSLILLDLGARYHDYNADITRTYPASGKFTDRQKQIYSLVLKANRAVAAAAKPGVSLRDLNDLTCKVLGEGLVELGLLETADEVDKYYMHGVSHPIGLDVHDISEGEGILQPGWIISNEPGLYIDEEETGIRIEDDLLITEEGCECLSEGVMHEIDEIEAFMAANRIG